MLVGVGAVAIALSGCAAPPTALPATASPTVTPAATGTPVLMPSPALPAATWTPMVTLAPQAYLEAMREAASAMRLAAKALEHTDSVLTQHVADATRSREVTSLGAGDGRIVRMTRDSILLYQERRMLTPALTNAVAALGLADTIYRMLPTGEGDPLEMLLSIKDAEAQLAVAQADLVQELIAQGVPAEQADKLVR
jgi:hypothetical protein